MVIADLPGIAPATRATLWESADPDGFAGRNSQPASAAAVSPETTRASLGERTDWSVTRVGRAPKRPIGVAAGIVRTESRRDFALLAQKQTAHAYSLVAKDSRPTGSKVARAEAMEKGPRLAWASERGGGTAA